MPKMRSEYVNERFGTLLREHLDKIGMNANEASTHLVLFMGGKPNTHVQHIRHYLNGNLMGAYLSARSRGSATETKFERLANSLFFLGVSEDSELIKVIEEEAIDEEGKLVFSYPPQLTPLTLTLPAEKQLQTIVLKLLLLTPDERERVMAFVGSL